MNEPPGPALKFLEAINRVSISLPPPPRGIILLPCPFTQWFTRCIQYFIYIYLYRSFIDGINFLPFPPPPISSFNLKLFNWFPLTVINRRWRGGIFILFVGRVDLIKWNLITEEAGAGGGRREGGEEGRESYKNLTRFFYGRFTSTDSIPRFNWMNE